jgi:type IV secretory pathway VirB2 component (pilin)
MFNTIKSFSQKNFVFVLLFSLVLAFVSFDMMESFAADPVAAGDTMKENGIVRIFCNVINVITGAVGKVIAVLILASLAISLFLGKVTWGLAIATMVGMGLLFGATSLVDTISAGTGTGEKAETLCKVGDGK